MRDDMQVQEESSSLLHWSYWSNLRSVYMFAEWRNEIPNYFSFHVRVCGMYVAILRMGSGKVGGKFFHPIPDYKTKITFGQSKTTSCKCLDACPIDHSASELSNASPGLLWKIWCYFLHVGRDATNWRRARRKQCTHVLKSKYSRLLSKYDKRYELPSSFRKRNESKCNIMELQPSNTFDVSWMSRISVTSFALSTLFMIYELTVILHIKSFFTFHSSNRNI